MTASDRPSTWGWPRVRLGIAWIALALAVGLRGHQAWRNFKIDERADGNQGHTLIDFGGQYMFGRMLLEGHGRELYSRDRHRELARASFARVHVREEAFPNSSATAGNPRETRPQSERDADRLVAWYPTTPDSTLAGPLYPPIHAFVMAPIAGIDNPQIAYRVWQGVMLGCVLAAGWGVRLLTNGRWWWPVASVYLIGFTGARAGIDLGQNAAITVMLLIMGWALRLRNRPVAAGVVWGLLAFKPVWALSFFIALIFLRQWRMLFAMGATGLALIAATLPVVGVETWKNWLAVGRIAAGMYDVDKNWIFLSRDLFGIPRRFMLEFEPEGSATNNRPIVALIGWASWAVIFLITAVVARRRRLNTSLIGPGPALAFLAAWLLTYHFMYYDSQVACFAIVVMLAVPARSLRWSSWPIASWGLFWALIPLPLENVIIPNSPEFTLRFADKDPSILFAINDLYPTDTLLFLVVWAWCLRTVWFRWERDFV